MHSIFYHSIIDLFTLEAEALFVPCNDMVRLKKKFTENEILA